MSYNIYFTEIWKFLNILKYTQFTHSLSSRTVNVQYSVYRSNGGNTSNPNSYSSNHQNAVASSPEPAFPFESRSVPHPLHHFQSRPLISQTHHSLGPLRSGSASSNSIVLNYLLFLSVWLLRKCRKKIKSNLQFPFTSEN